MKDEMVSVVIPMYNAERTIKECLYSVIRQTYSNLEIIIVDDGSYDKSKDICESIIDKHPERLIELISASHRGVVNARKVGVHKARGKFITFIDSDDYIASDCIGNMVTGIANADFCMTGIYIDKYSSDGRSLLERKKLKTVPEARFYDGDEYDKLLVQAFGLNMIYMVNVWGKMFITEKLRMLFDKINNSIMFGEDCIGVYLYALNSSSMNMLNDSGYYYKICEEQNDKKYNENLFQNITYLIEFYKNYQVKEEKEKINKIMKAGILSNYLNIAIAQNIKLLDLPIFYYPYYGRLNEKRVVLYGAGSVGKSYYISIKKDEKVRLVAWVDKNAEQIMKEDKLPLQNIDFLRKIEFDYVVIAVFSEELYEIIKGDLLNEKIPKERLLWSPTRKALLY